MSTLQILSLVSSVAISVTIVFVIWHRHRIQEYIAHTPPPKPLKHLWLAPFAGTTLAIVFALSLLAYRGIHLTTPLVIILGAGAVITLAIGTVFTLAARREHIWEPTQRYRFGLGLIFVAAVLILASLFFSFSRL